MKDSNSVVGRTRIYCLLWSTFSRIALTTSNVSSSRITISYFFMYSSRLSSTCNAQCVKQHYFNITCENALQDINEWICLRGQLSVQTHTSLKSIASNNIILLWLTNWWQSRCQTQEVGVKTMKGKQALKIKCKTTKWP